MTNAEPADSIRHIALEEAFSVPELERRLPPPDPHYSVAPAIGAEWTRRLADLDRERIAAMDTAGIDIQVLSLTLPGLQVAAQASVAVDGARFVNDFLGARIEEHPDRFRGFAALPLQDADAAAEELRRCVEQLGFCGALVNNCGPCLYLDEPRFEPLWAALEELDVPLYLHPGAPPADGWNLLEGHPELRHALWSWGAETGGHALRLLFGGVFDRHPRARLILGHMGEFLPYQRSRLDSRWATLQQDHPLDRRPSAYLGTNIVFTTSGVFSPAALLGAVLEVGADALMFSVDYPYEVNDDAVRGLAGTTLSDSDRHAIAHGTAERLLRIPPA